jgi:hypothetical protein
MIKSWDSNLEIDSAKYTISRDAAGALHKLIKHSQLCQNYKSILEIQDLEISKDLKSVLTQDLIKINTLLEDLYGFLILKPIIGLNIREQAIVPWIISQLMGETLGQNYNNDEIYLVNDVGGKMEDGYRYSRTNQGGSIHTDGVNVKKPFDYFLLHIISQGFLGGESIIVNGLSIYNYLRKNMLEVIEILSEDFLYEYKGVQENKYYTEPILKIINDIPMWRYLRNYIEEASIKKGLELSIDKVWAMDCLDSVLESSSFQLRYRIMNGETIFVNDRNIFHGRTCYVDEKKSEYFSDIDKHRINDTVIKRTGLRIWINSNY